jgi:hypothetical protein
MCALVTRRHIPQSYLLALECFVKTKRDVFVSSERQPSTAHTAEEVMFDRQFKFVHALLKQTTSRPSVIRNVTESSARLVHVRRPEIGIGSQAPVRQGPFLLTPAPDELEEGTGEDASDITYVLCSSNPPQFDMASVDNDLGELRDEPRRREEDLGVVLVAHGSGMIDVCLDTDKVHALWEDSQAPDVVSKILVPPLTPLTLILDGRTLHCQSSRFTRRSTWVLHPPPLEQVLGLSWLQTPLCFIPTIYNTERSTCHMLLAYTHSISIHGPPYLPIPCYMIAPRRKGPGGSGQT